MIAFRLVTATLLPALFAVLFYLLEKKTKFSGVSYSSKQIVIGIVFGGIAILATEFGIPVEGAILNVRTAAPVTAGLLFGGPAGIIAGIIGGVERWFCVYWGGGEYTRLACTLATIMAGFFAAAIRKYMFDNKKASFIAGFTIGLTTEVLHMLLVFLTNMSDIHRAFETVEQCAFPMIFLNSIAVALSLGLITLIGKEKKVKKEQKQIAQIYQSGLMACVVLAFCITCIFIAVLQEQISNESADSTLKLAIEEVPENLEGATENTFTTYAQWIADDIAAEENLNNQFFSDLEKTYMASEILVLSSKGTVQSGNIPGAVGMTVPDEVVLPSGKDKAVWDYGKSFIDTDEDMQYVAVNIDNDSFALVGYDKEFVTAEITKQIGTLAANKHVGQDGFLLIGNEDGLIVSGKAGKTGKTLSSLGVDLSNVAENRFARIEMSDGTYRLMYRQIETPAGEYSVIAVLPEKEAMFARNTSVYIMAFMEILVFAALFINMYFLTKRVVVDNIHKINNSLAKITEGNLNEKIDVRENEEFTSLTDDINSTVNTLKYYIAEAEARIDKELEFAKAIQHSALPSVFPPYPNRKDFDIYALMDTAKEVGGDFYDFYLLENDRLGFLIADVSGKGIPAAMFMMTAKTAIKGLAESGMEVNDIFTQANATLCEGNDTGMFVTAWIGIIDLRTGLLTFANAGHNPPLIRHKNGSFEYLRTRPNFILAGMKTTKYKKQELQLAPGDEIFLYTDGVTEAKNSEKQMFREEKLKEILNINPEEGVESRCNTLLEEIGVFVGDAEQFDDITMLSIKLNHLQTFDRIVVCPDLDSTDAVWEFIDYKIKKAQLPRKLAAKLKVCTDEVYSNILRYSEASKAEIFCRIDENLLTLIFRDNGIHYDPTASKEPDVSLPANEREIGGLGIYMVKKSVKSIDYAYTDNQNVLTLTFDY